MIVTCPVCGGTGTRPCSGITNSVMTCMACSGTGTQRDDAHLLAQVEALTSALAHNEALRPLTMVLSEAQSVAAMTALYEQLRAENAVLKGKISTLCDALREAGKDAP